MMDVAPRLPFGISLSLFRRLLNWLRPTSQNHSFMERNPVPQLPFVLISNDDGIHAPGIHALAKEIAQIARVAIVAPHMERSANSHCLTISRPLRIQKLEPKPYSEEIYEVDGTPVDCVKIALDTILEEKPDLVLSGINRGGNLGTDVLYSGTVAAAMEGTINGCKAMAFSAHGPGQKDLYYETSAKVARILLEKRKDLNLQEGTMLNVNIPARPFEQVRGVRSTTCGNRIYDDHYWRKEDPRGLPYYWIGADSHRFVDIPGSDCNAVADGFVAISALKPELLDREANSQLSRKIPELFEGLF